MMSKYTFSQNLKCVVTSLIFLQGSLPQFSLNLILSILWAYSADDYNMFSLPEPKAQDELL